MVTKFQTVLAIDTAMSGCGVGLYEKDAARSFKDVQPMMRGQAEALIPMVDKLLAEAGVPYERLDAIVTSVGPGAFTGLRIGISAARALGLACDIPVLGMTSLQALASLYAQYAKDSGRESFAVLIETKRADFYVQFFLSNGEPLSEAAALPYSKILNALKQKGIHILIGDALARFEGLLTAGECEGLAFEAGYELPDPALMASLLCEGGGVDSAQDLLLEDTAPLYLRGADVSISKKKQRVLESVIVS